MTLQASECVKKLRVLFRITLWPLKLLCTLLQDTVQWLLHVQLVGLQDVDELHWLHHLSEWIRDHHVGIYPPHFVSEVGVFGLVILLERIACFLPLVTPQVLPQRGNLNGQPLVRMLRAFWVL